MQEKDTQQLCRMTFLKVHRLFSAPKFDKEPLNIIHIVSREKKTIRHLNNESFFCHSIKISLVNLTKDFYYTWSIRYKTVCMSLSGII